MTFLAKLVVPYGPMVAAWGSVLSYLFVLHVAVGLSYYSSLPAPMAIAPVYPPTTPIVIVPPEHAPHPQVSPSPPPSPLDGILANEPAPKKLRRRLLIVVLQSHDLAVANAAEKREIPLFMELELVQKDFGSDLAGGRIYTVGSDSEFSSWSSRTPDKTIASPFLTYADAVAGGSRALNSLVTPLAHDKYDVLLVWYSHDQPDVDPQEVALNTTRADQLFLLWAGYASHEDSHVLRHIFPGRLWLLSKQEPPGMLSGFIRSQLSK